MSKWLETKPTVQLCGWPCFLPPFPGSETNSAEVDGNYFQHVHSSELNTYDFTDWVREHPGGPDKIMKWTTMGYVLKHGLCFRFFPLRWLDRKKGEVKMCCAGTLLKVSLQTILATVKVIGYCL